MTAAALTRPATLAAVLRKPATRDAVASALAGIHGLSLQLHLGEPDAVPPELLLGGRPEVLLVDADLASPSHHRALADLAERCADGPLILVTAEHTSVGAVRLLLRLGISDLLPQPLGPESLRESVQVAVRNARGRPVVASPVGGGRIVAFLKAGGGVGATSLAVQAACALAGSASGGTCLLDLDLQFGSAALHLDVEHPTALLDHPDLGERFDNTLLRSAMAHHRTGVDLLPAPKLLHPLDLVTPETAVTLVRAAAAEYGHVLVDLPPCWTVWTRAVLAEAAAIVLVLRPDVPSIHQARRQLETLAAEGLGAVPLVPVANFAPSGLFGRTLELADAAKALGRPIHHVIPRAEAAFLEAANLGLPLAEVKGGRRAARRIRSMIDAVLATA